MLVCAVDSFSAPRSPAGLERRRAYYYYLLSIPAQRATTLESLATPGHRSNYSEAPPAALLPTHPVHLHPGLLAQRSKNRLQSETVYSSKVGTKQVVLNCFISGGAALISNLRGGGQQFTTKHVDVVCKLVTARDQPYQDKIAISPQSIKFTQQTLDLIELAA